MPWRDKTDLFFLSNTTASHPWHDLVVFKPTLNLDKLNPSATEEVCMGPAGGRPSFEQK